MANHTPAPSLGAVVIPFPRFSRPEHDKLPVDFKSSDFNAGFEFAMAMVRNLKAAGCFVSNRKGA